MKRLFFALLTIIIALTLAACDTSGGGGGTSGDGNNDSIENGGGGASGDESCLHILGSDGHCTVCSSYVAPTVGVKYALSSDGTYATVTGYTGTDTRLVIASTYEGVPVKTIAEDAFSESSITELIIPESIEYVGYWAFCGCTSLRAVTFAENSKVTLGSWAFLACTSLSSVTFGESVLLNIGNCVFDNCSPALFTEYNYGVYIGSKDNQHAALIDITDKSLSSYEIHEDTRFIGYGAFSDCSQLESITIPDGVESIGEYAFYSCNSLTTLTVPSSVIKINKCAFLSTSVTAINVSENNEYYTSIDGDLYSKDGKTLLQYCLGKTDAFYCVPDGIEIIGNDALSGCTNVTSISIPASVVRIDDSAFNYCSNLESVMFDDDSRLTSIGSGAFFSCSKLKTIAFGKNSQLSSVEDEAFAHCTELASVYYGGTAEQWAEIDIHSAYNSHLTDATRYYFSESEPAEDGNFWYYDEDGNIAVW